MVDGIQVSGINVGDTDLSVTLRRQISTTTTTSSNNTTSNMSSLPVTVIAAKLPITNLTQLLSTVEATRSLAMATINNNDGLEINVPDFNVYPGRSQTQNIEITSNRSETVPFGIDINDTRAL